ncbi:hypothetical protein TNCV_1419281 [Trichonephila clavipes]|nr:hypothetical protein TNCV_1419281 [Trichonephila clavipes]
MVDFHKRIFLSDEAHFWLNGYVNKQNCRIWSEANPQVYVETPLHPEKLTVWCALWADLIAYFKPTKSKGAYARDYDGPQNFEPLLSDETDILVDTLFTILPLPTLVKTLSLNRFNMHQLFYTVGLQKHQESNLRQRP